jgi:tetratricopeptide (TPR) repeat protein
MSQPTKQIRVIGKAVNDILLINIESNKKAEILTKLNIELTDALILSIGELVDILQQNSEFPEAEKHILRCIDIDSSRPENWIKLAHHQRLFDKNIPAAINSIDIAICKARSSNQFFIQANIEKISILLELSDIHGIEKCIKSILEYDIRDNQIDSGFEFGFIENLKMNGVSIELIDCYFRRFAK